MKIKDLESRVRAILIKEPASRASDDWLYYFVISEMGFDMNAVTAKDFLLTYRNRKLPSIESVGRCRRKVQEERPDLKPCKKIQEARRTKQDEFYKWSQLKQQSFDF